jgi:uncharacterized protein (DUF952 family)
MCCCSPSSAQLCVVCAGLRTTHHITHPTPITTTHTTLPHHISSSPNITNQKEKLKFSRMSDPQFVYKILTEDQWHVLDSTGSFKGSPVDLQDGYIHLSAADTVEKTTEISFPLLAFPSLYFIRLFCLITVPILQTRGRSSTRASEVSNSYISTVKIFSPHTFFYFLSFLSLYSSSFHQSRHEAIKGETKWEFSASRNKSFPHLFRDLTKADLGRTFVLKRSESGDKQFVFPAEY